MPDKAEENEVARDLLEASEAIGRLSEDEGTFRAAVDAFRAQDGESFNSLLERLELRRYCRVVCDWLCTKECVLICLELCGPPPEKPPTIGEIREFAEVVRRVTADEELVELLATSVEDRDQESFKRLISEAKAERWCHLLCHWACLVRCRLICRVVCSPIPIRRQNLVEELAAAGETIGAIGGDEKAFAAVLKAVQTGDCDLVRGALVPLGLGGRCAVICEWFCSWRCVLLCLRFCLPFPLAKVDTSIKEMLEFAQASGRLRAEGSVLERLSGAVGREDPEAFAQAVKELQLERFCIQLCHWLCFFRCRVFCRCVCGPDNHPWFTHVGDFHIYADIDPGDGLTNKAVFGHGGPKFAFDGCLQLRGFCPKFSPSFPGVPMRYRFLYQELPAATQKPLVGDLLCGVNVGYRQVVWPDADTTSIPWKTKATTSFQTQTIAIEGSGATPPSTPPVTGADWYAPPTHVVVPDPDGWIEVDPDAGDDGYYGALIGFDTTNPFSDGDPAPGVLAGVEVPGPAQKNGRDLAIVFEATRVGVAGPADFTNSLPKIRINNWTEVQLLNLVQFHTGGGTPCSPLSTDLDIEYTADHEFMAQWFVQIITAASPPLVIPALPPISNPPADNITARGGFGVHHESIGSWPSCSYAVRLHTRRALTDGLVDASSSFIELTFCK